MGKFNKHHKVHGLSMIEIQKLISQLGGPKTAKGIVEGWLTAVVKRTQFEERKQG